MKKLIPYFNYSSCTYALSSQNTFIGRSNSFLHNNPQPNVVFAEPDLRSGSLLPRYPT